MKRKRPHREGMIILGIFAVLAVYVLIMFNPFQKIPPEGVPNNYFDMIDELAENEAEYLIYTNSLEFPEDVGYGHFSDLSEINRFVSVRNKFIILDVESYGEITEAEAQTLSDLYYNSCFHIIFLNMSEERYPDYDGLVDSQYKDEGFITLTFDSCSGAFYSGVTDSPFPSQDMLIYAVMHVILEMSCIENPTS